MNDWNCESRDKLRACGSDGTTVACSSSGTTRFGNGNLQRKNIGKCVRRHKRGILLVHRAKMEEKDFIDKMGVYDIVPRSAAAEKGCHVFRTRRVTVKKGSDDAPQLRARWVAQEFRGRCGDKHQYFSETPDLALVKSVIAHAARRAESEDIVVAVF